MLKGVNLVFDLLFCKFAAPAIAVLLGRVSPGRNRSQAKNKARKTDTYKNLKNSYREDDIGMCNKGWVTLGAT